MDIDEVFTATQPSQQLIQCCLMLPLNLQVECIMAILINKSLVKGYFAHKSKVAVVSKQDPFPRLNGKPVGS